MEVFKLVCLVYNILFITATPEIIAPTQPDRLGILFYFLSGSKVIPD